MQQVAAPGRHVLVAIAQLVERQFAILPGKEQFTGLAVDARQRDTRQEVNERMADDLDACLAVPVSSNDIASRSMLRMFVRQGV